jgi:hypothetical protein
MTATEDSRRVAPLSPETPPGLPSAWSRFWLALLRALGAWGV